MSSAIMLPTPPGASTSPGGPGVVAHQLLGVEGEQDRARVEAEADRDHDHGADREVPIVEDGEVQDGLASR